MAVVDYRSGLATFIGGSFCSLAGVKIAGFNAVYFH
jgi:hypothetical protein